ncbi:MAG: hypothetical protein ACKOZM_09040 [Flavobacteriales bacterium]
MKKTILLLSAGFLFLANNALAQMSDGKHTYANKEVTVELSVTDGGWTITTAKVTDNVTKKSSVGKGAYRTTNGVEWYEFQTAECNYDFDAPAAGKLTLSQFDCKNGQKDIKYTLTKK